LFDVNWCEGYFRQTNDVEAKCLHQLQTNNKDMFENEKWLRAHLFATNLFSSFLG
jgi:hypothetical protein